MRFTVASRRNRIDLEAHNLRADTELADLIECFHPQPPDLVSVDGAAAPLDQKVGKIPDGASIELDVTAADSRQPVVVELHALAGPLAGRLWRLVEGNYTAGLGATIDLPDCERFTIDVDRAGTAIVGGVATDPAFWAGPHHLQFVAPPSAVQTPAASRWYFNRPPRPRRPPDEMAIDAPTRVPVQGRSRRISAITMTAPVLTGVFLAVVFNRMLFLAFAVISPVMMIGNAWDDRRRRRRDMEESDATFRQELEVFEAEVLSHQADRLARSYASLPSIAELVSRADRGAVTLWERRPTHNDFATLIAGYGAARATVPLAGSARREPEVADLVERLGVLPCAPITVEMGAGRSLGIVGTADGARSAARSLIGQAAVLHGPADLRIAIVTNSPSAWDWAKWLPHTCVNGGTEVRLLSGGEREIDQILGFLRATPADGDADPLTLLVVDHPDLSDDQRKVLTAVLAGTGRSVTGIVLAADLPGLPSRCTSVFDVSTPDGALWQPGRAHDVVQCLPVTIDPDVATRLARRLTHLDDPEAVHAGAGLPAAVALLDLLALPDPAADAVARRWAGRPRLSTPVGVTEAGALQLDLVADGPHGLLAGTTGSGKSEFLRSLVVGLATAVDTDHLNFVLIDYKGGAAFDVCAELPHVVGVVTDLDEELGGRALACLEAELRHREGRLREAGVASIDELWASGPSSPLPRLAVVVDEFATLAAELPDFMDALVDIAQRGRSLGVHMLLATQRPAGIVKDSIRANTNLRISLRVQTPADSSDVLGAPDAARISRAHPGRGLVRLGPGELIPFQTALVSRAGDGSPADLRITPFVFGMHQPAAPQVAKASDGPSDLARLVQAIRSAHARRDAADPRRPWPDPLPGELVPADLAASPPGSASIGLVDLPDLQRQETWTWDAFRDGNLLLAGIPLAGPGETAVAAAAGLARSLSPDDLHIYGIDHGTGTLDALAVLPHVGAVVPAGAVDRQIRLLEYLVRQLHHRMAGGRPTPAILLVLDGLSGFRSAFDDPELVVYRDRLQEIVAAGPARGIHTIVTADQARSLPGAMAGALPLRLVFALADRLDYSTLGVAKAPRDLPAGRAVDARTGRRVQTITEATQAISAACGWDLPAVPPDPIATLAQFVALDEVLDAGAVEPTRWELPIGLDDRLLQPATIALYDGDHLLISGPRRSGRSTALATVAAAVRKLDESVRIVAVASARSPLVEHPAIDQLKTIDDLGDLGCPTLLLIDDAESLDDPHGVLADLLAAVGSPVHVVAAGRTDVLRSLPRHWTRALRTSRRGVVLQPGDTSDGDVVGVRLPRTGPITIPGRGYLVDGSATLVQVATA